MTSKSPDLQGHDEEHTESVTGAGPVSGATDKLSQLREAISEIDQRHAEGESGFFVELSETGDGEDSARFDDGDSFVPADDEDDVPDFDASYAKAKKTAMNMLAMRDHSSGELREKLLKRDFLPAAVDELIVKLENSRLLNDEEFAHRYVRAHRERRKLSRSVLKRELSKKGIAPELISEAVDTVDGEEDLAREVAEKKAASTRRLDYHVRERRILGMLARRGFSSAICIRVTREVLAEG